VAPASRATPGQPAAHGQRLSRQHRARWGRGLCHRRAPKPPAHLHRNGILKAEAARRFAGALAEHGIERLQDVTAAATSRQLEAAVRAIPGQRSGISLTYFFMLAGSDDLVKPDRMLGRFLRGCLSREVDPEETQELLTAATAQLRVRYPQLTPGLLDQAIWQQQRSLAVRRRPSPG
jgi:hypothetical protein